MNALECSFRREHMPFRLTQEILERSSADNWDEAKLEWELSHVFFADSSSPGTCLCGHFPIIEHCVIRNRVNGNLTVVGNHCVVKFLGLPSGKLFEGLGKIAKDNRKAMNVETLEYAHEQGWINDWQRDFYLSTLRIKRLSPRQLAKRIEVNDRVIFYSQQET